MVKRKMHKALGTLWSVQSYVLFWQPFLELTSVPYYGMVHLWYGLRLEEDENEHTWLVVETLNAFQLAVL